MAENVIGLNIEEGVRKQIKKRQEKLGQTDITPDIIQYTNANSSWMRLASSVDLNEENEYAPKGSDLAKNLVLFGPNVKITDTYSDPTAVDVVTGENASDRIYTPYLPTQALTSFNGEYYNAPGSSYGLGDVGKYGFSGPPGIESIEVQALNRGAIRKANLSIVAQNPAQFKLIEALYLRLGFSMLVEWGHTMYYDNDGNFITSPPFSNQAFDSFINGGKSFLSIARKIENVRKETDYNYDGFIGYVTNFNWSYRPNGTYSISLSLISRGGLIDSLTVNQPALLVDNENPFRTFPVTKKEQKAINRLTEEELVTVDEKGNQFFEAVAISSTQDDNVEEETLKNANAKPRDIIELFINLTRLHLKNRSESKTDSNAPKHYTLGQGKYQNTFALKFDNGENTGESQENYYIELGRLCLFISNNCLLYAKEGTTDEDQIVNIDYSYNKSYMLSHPLQTSADPGVCVFQTEIENKRNNVVSSIPNSLKHQTSFRKGFYKVDLMQIPINIEYIRNILINERDEDNKIDLLTFLDKILEGVRIATGLLNNFVVSYDENDNIVRIYDDNYIPGARGGKTATINVNYLKDNEGTFVNSINLRSKIFPKLQNLVAIASQNPNGASVGENVASYQKLNQEYQDRIANHSPTGYTVNELETDGETNSFENTFNDSYKRLTDFLVDTYGFSQWKLPSSNLIDQAKKDLESILNYEVQKDVQNGRLPSPFFIPIELDISMKGLAGFKLYEKFDITPDDILPSNYPSNLNYIIQGVSHTIKNNTWETSLKTLSWIAGTGVSKNPTSPNPSKYVVGKSPNYEDGSASATTSDQYDGRTATGDPVTQNRIVLKLNRILQNDVETLGILEVYESDETTLIERYVTVELPWKGNQNRVSCIPQGEYSFETRAHQKFGECFFLTGNAENNFNGGGLGQLPAANTGYVRDSVFIHTAPQAIGWLEGCIGPGFKFNTKGNPTHSFPQTGIGSNYRDPAKLESRQALTQIYNHVINSTGGFGKMTIRNGYGMFGVPFTNFNDPQLQNILIGLNLV
jgi:hypothetical protein